MAENSRFYEVAIPPTVAREYRVPAAESIHAHKYNEVKRGLQMDLLQLQESLIKSKGKLVIVIEGRDAAGKGSTSKTFLENLNTSHSELVVMGVPTKTQMRTWLHSHEEIINKSPEVVVFDRSWYSRAMIQPVMGYCSMAQYKYFMKHVNEWEENLTKSGIHLIKIYLSVSRESQITRFMMRRKSPLKYWKFSANDRAALENWHLYTYFKERMFSVTSTDYAPWYIINSDNKLAAHLSTMHLILDRLSSKQPIKRLHGFGNKNVNTRHLASMEVDGVWFYGLNESQVSVLEQLKIHAD